MTLVGKPNKEIFTIISNSLNKMGMERSPDCCLKKLQALKREFRKYKEKVNSSGESGDLYPPASIAAVYEDLDETIGKDPLTIPLLITSDNLDGESIQSVIEKAEDRQDKRFLNSGCSFKQKKMRKKGNTMLRCYEAYLALKLELKAIQSADKEMKKRPQFQPYMD